MATGKYSHGKSKGTSDRKSSGRLSTLSGTTGPIKQYNLKQGVGSTPQFKTITNDYFQSQPLSVPAAIQIPDAPKAPDDSQNLRNLATALGDVNTKLNQFIPDFWNFQKSMDVAARREAERQAAEGEPDANTKLNQAKGALEKKAEEDPDAKNAYGIFASMDSRVERELGVVNAKNRGLNVISNLENYAMEIYESSFNDETRLDQDSGAIIPLNPSTPEFTTLLVNKLKTDIDNPRAFLELQDTAQRAIINARASVSKVHAEYKDTTSVTTLSTSFGSTLLTAKDASENVLLGNTESNIAPLSFTNDINHFRLKSGTSIKNYQTHTEPTKLLELIANSTVLNSDRTNLVEMSDKALTMLYNTRIGAGDGQLLSEKVGGKEVLEKLWKRAISNSINEAYRVNDLVAVNQAENEAESFAVKLFSNDGDADLVQDGIQSFGTHTTYTINGIAYKVKVGPNTVNLQGVLEYVAREKKNAYKKFNTGAEILAYQNELDDQLQGWLKAKGIGEQNVNDAWLRNRIMTSNNPIETEALIVHFANEKWITQNQKNLLLQDNTLKTKIETQRDNFNATMKVPYSNVEQRLKSLFSILDENNELEPEKWSVEHQRLFREEINNFKQMSEETFGALSDDTYGQRIEKIKEAEKELLKKLDGYIEQARKGENPFEVQTNFENRVTTNVEQNVEQNVTKSESTDETLIETNNTDNKITTAEGIKEVISKEDYALLSNEERRKYEPVPRVGGERFEPGGGYVKEYRLKEKERILLSTSRDRYSDSTLKEYLKLNNIKGGRGDDRQNTSLKAEVLSTPIYKKEELMEQINRLEQLADMFPDGFTEEQWNKLPYNLNTNQKVKREIDFKGIQTIIRRTGLTPKVYFQSQINAHGIEMPEELFDRLFPESDDEQLQSSSILDQGTLVASTNLKGVLPNARQELETQMLDVIHKGESTLDTKFGGYEAFNQGGADDGKTVLGFSGTYGDHPANKGKKLTEMTIQEILDIQDSGYNTELYPFNAEGTKRWHDSGGIHAAGRYQFIRSGLRDAMELAGIEPTEKFTPEIQDRLAIALLVNRGPDWWTSMKGNKELIELLKKYKETENQESSTMRGRSDIA